MRRTNEFLAEVDAGGDVRASLVLPGLEHTYFFHGFNMVRPEHYPHGLLVIFDVFAWRRWTLNTCIKPSKLYAPLCVPL